jgi:hypothetical protein
MPAGLDNALGDLALSLTAAGAGTTNSGSIAPGGRSGAVFVGVHCTAITGTTPTLDVSLEESTTGESAWTAVAGSAVTQVTAAGHRVAFAVPTKNFVRVVATVGGTTPAVTARVAVLVFAD